MLKSLAGYGNPCCRWRTEFMTYICRQLNNLAAISMIAVCLVSTANTALAGEVAEDRDDATPLELLETTIMPGTAQRLSWVRANNGGILLADVSLGSTVRQGDLLGTITDPMSNASIELRSPYSGRIIGMARNQVVMPGFAAFHIGIQTDATPSDMIDDVIPDLKQDESDVDVDGMSE